MNVRHLMVMLTIPCACIAAEQAIGQDRSVYGPQETATRLTPATPAERDRSRIPILEDRERSRPIEMLESWTLSEQAELGIGRFRVGEIARARTHNERVRENLMIREDRAIAGAGIRIRFD